MNNAANYYAQTTQPTEEKSDKEIIGQIAAAYFSNNLVAPPHIKEVINNIREAMAGEEPEAVKEELRPAVPIKRSVQPDFIICLEDGKKFKSLKRHLMTHYNMTPEDYRQKWGLPVDYPMTAPNYAAARSELAKKMGLGQRTPLPVVEAPKARKLARGGAKGRSSDTALAAA